MKISERLRVIGDLIPDNSFVLDIGCDHALLDIYIVKKNKNIKTIASDINKGPLEIAKENVKKYNLENKINLKQENGLNAYEKGIDTIVLSGLGTTTIIDILNKRKEVLKNIKNLVISSNNDYYKLRKSITDLGFKIQEEKMVYDKNKYYPVILFVPGIEKYNYYELKFGPLLLKRKDKIFLRYLYETKTKLLKIYNLLEDHHETKKEELQKDIAFIEKNIL